MVRAIHTLRRLRSGERGMSLPELMVAMFILAFVLIVFLSTLAVVQKAAQRQGRRSENNDRARLAVEQLDREIRSGNVLYDPATEDPAGFVLRIYTQSNAPTREPSPGYICRLWQITEDQDLRTRTWPPGQPAAATPWRTVATGIVNRITDPAQIAFEIDDDPYKGQRTVDVVLLVNGAFARYANETVRIEASISGRNTSYGFPQGVCSETPA